LTALSLLKIVAIVVGTLTILMTAYSLIFLRNPERRESFQRKIEASAGSEKIGGRFGKIMIAMMLFPIFIFIFIQPFQLLTLGLAYVLPKTTVVTRILSASAYAGMALAVVSAFLVCRWFWIRMTPKPSS
jgi:hypothetical protein